MPERIMAREIERLTAVSLHDPTQVGLCSCTERAGWCVCACGGFSCWCWFGHGCWTGVLSFPALFCFWVTSPVFGGPVCPALPLDAFRWLLVRMSLAFCLLALQVVCPYVCLVPSFL